MEKEWGEFLAHPPALVIFPTREGFGLKARDRIPLGAVIQEFTGLKSDPSCIKKFADYFDEGFIQEIQHKGFNNTDAKTVGNETRFIRCGFPNAAIDANLLNGTERNLIFSINTIEPGEEILVDFGINMLHLTLGIQEILGKEKMELAFKKHGQTFIHDLMEAEAVYEKKLLNKSLVLEEMLAWSLLQSWFIFPIHNPTAMIYLHFKKFFDYSSLHKILDSGRLKFAESLTSQPNYQHMINIFKILKKIKIKFKKNEWKKIAEWTLSRLEKIPLVDILKGLDLFSKGKKENEVNQALKKYDWLKDVAHPFSYQRRLENLLEIYQEEHKEKALANLKKSISTVDPDTEPYQMTLEVIRRIEKFKK